MASPSDGETLSPPTQQPLITHAPATPGQRPHQVAVVGRQRGQPAAVLGDADRRVLEDRKLLAHAARQPPQHLDVERQLGDVERRRQRRQVDLQRIGLVRRPASARRARDGRRRWRRSRGRSETPASTPGIGSVIRSWWRVGTTGSGPPSAAATTRAQPPAASTTMRVAMVPPGVRTPSTPRGPISNPVAGRVREQHGAELLRGAAVADRQLRRLDVAVGRAPRDGDDAALAEDGQAPARLGDGDEVDVDADGVAAAPPRAPSCSASRSVRAIFSAPLCVKRSGCPVSAVKAASLVTARWARRVSAGVARTWLDSPAARGEVCEASAARSSTTTRAPRCAR